ncbi:hypothetical protein MNBD_GAMMA16-706 [hydrothermal vent metagenome]|uniref:Uncharacterized protein n=1 Tax=hydrothermal vent metagenome TaxID=652676 RepID=A0A3B0YTV1_9ZZZZ
MIEALTIALGKTLVSYLFTVYLGTFSGVSIDGAPNWYYQEAKHQICSFHAEPGGTEKIEFAKDKTQRIMVKKIDGIIEIIIYDNFQKVRDGKEKSLITQFMNDAQLPVFVKKNTDFERIEYHEKPNKVFIKACVDKKILIDYEKNRLQKIKNAITHHRKDKAFDELEGSIFDKPESLEL